MVGERAKAKARKNGETGKYSLEKKGGQKKVVENEEGVEKEVRE